MKAETSIRRVFLYIKFLKIEKSLSFQEIAQELNKDNYRTKEGKIFNEMKVYEIWQQFEEDILTNISRKDLIRTTKELNQFLELDPPINLDLDIMKLIEMLKEAEKLIDPIKDVLTPQTNKILSQIKQ